MGNKGGNFGPYQCSRKNKLSRESTGRVGLSLVANLLWGQVERRGKGETPICPKGYALGALKELETGLGGLEKDAMLLGKGPPPLPRSYSTQPGQLLCEL